jgi:protoporphyrinogen oxidase
MTTSQPIAVIGAGIAGLAAAYDLARAGYPVSVFEASSEVGGLAAGFRAPNWEWPLERFYHHIFSNDADILALAKEIGLGDRVIFRRPVTSMWYQGKAYPFDNPQRVLMFPHLSLPDKLRMGFTIAYLRYVAKNWHSLENNLADPWLDHWMGSRAYGLLWRPMLQGKFGDHYRDVNLAWFWARIVKRTPSLGYFVGGFQAFADRLAERVQALGGQLYLNTAVQRIESVGGNGRSTTSVRVVHGGQPEDFAAVIATVPPGLLMRMVPDLSPDYLAGLAALKSMGAVVMTLAVDRQIAGGDYWVNLPKAEGFPFLAFVEHTNYMDAAHYGGDHVLYCGDYLDPGHPYFSMSDDELLAAFLPGIQRLRPDFQRSWIRQMWVHKTTYAQPVPPLNYSRMIPDLATPVPGLYFASMSQVYPWDRGTNYAVEMGRRVARLVLEGGLTEVRVPQPAVAVPAV